MGNADSKAVEHESSTVKTSELPSKDSQDVSYDRRLSKKEPPQSRDDDNTTKITDDQIQVNLAMADLMAYLQVVANNSNHLPLTRRDDPELDRMVASLTSEEYAKKSAAFVPADIRMMGATFTRYGRVWDLPTSEEYNASDGALEPGRSYGGACCNTFLKVVYDAANDAAGAAQTDAANEALFDDDDDEDEEVSAFMSKSYRSGFSLDMGSQNNVAVTWADLLRQMKAEFKEIGYAQIPKLTSSRKIDMNKPFSLVPENFDPLKNKKRALLIGCNYAALGDAELKASYDDIRSMKDYIVNVHSFPESKELMTILLDDGEHEAPTFLNIIDAFKALSEESQPGDAVFVQFSGHGGRVLDAPVDDEAESYDEVIVPSDYQTSGLIRDTLIFKTLLAPMRFGVTVTIMVDCCDNGMVMELPYSWSTKADKKDTPAKLAMNEDFSFVRFLKVVKTLYESSTFTQLGKTVGSALGPLSSPVEKLDNYRESDKDDDVVDNEERMTNAINRSGSTIFDALAQACSPHHSRRTGHDDLSVKSTEDEKKDELSPYGETLFERVINCTLISGNDDEYSDEDTLKTRTYDYHSYDGESFTEQGESFDSMTDDDEESRRRRSSRRRRRHRHRRR